VNTVATTIRSAQETYLMLDRSSIWDAARRCDLVLGARGLPHAIAGGVAVCLHGYQRNTVDVDILVRSEDAAAVRRTMEEEGCAWDPVEREFRGPDRVPIQFLLSGESASDDQALGVKLPDPGEPGVVTEIERLPVVSLVRLIELKLASGLGNLRRTHRDFADVVELIAVHGLSRSFARHLHKSLRKEFRDLVLRARGEA
jgi:hypothetical protein